MDRFNDTVKAKIHAKADGLGINRDALFIAVDVIAEQRLDGVNLANTKLLDGEIVSAVIQHLYSQAYNKAIEDLQSKDKKVADQATNALRYLTDAEIEEMPAPPPVKNALRLWIEKPTALAPVAIWQGFEDLKKWTEQTGGKSLAEVALEHCQDEIEQVYEACRLREAGASEREILKHLNGKQ